MATNTFDAVLDNLRRVCRRQEVAGLTDGELLECFIARRDESAFEALLRRHAPMVLGVCRRTLRHEADAEDAFQATFLVLVRKAGTIRPRTLVGNWLYGVARTTALKAKAMRSKRRVKEKTAGTRPKPETPPEVWRQLETVLDQELQALPDRYRAPIVLCDLEGKSIKEAARQLGRTGGDHRHPAGAGGRCSAGGWPVTACPSRAPASRPCCLRTWPRPVCRCPWWHRRAGRRTCSPPGRLPGFSGPG